MKYFYGSHFLLGLLLFLYGNSIYAQTISRCGTDEYLQFQLSQNPNLQSVIDQVEHDLQNYLQSQAFQSQKQAGGVFKIPVVVHLIGNYVIDRVSDAKVEQQITILNQDYRKIAGTNGDGTGADTKIEFCLAKIDPNSDVTTGIVKIPDPSGNPFPSPWITNANSTVANSDNALKSLSHWPEDEYLNIYVVKDIISLIFPSSSTEVLGYGFRPSILSSHPEWDGVVIDIDYFGITTDDHYKLGRTLTHEVGHWFDLLHTWGWANLGCPDCSGTDWVDDTPPCCDKYYSYFSNGCPHPSQCSNTRQIENYMDYSDDKCMNMFTQGQADRMWATLNTSRSSFFSPLTASCTLLSHCTNQTQDADETGIDCGGVDCLPCSGSSGSGTCTYPLSVYVNCGPRNNWLNIYSCLKGATDGDFRNIYSRNFNIGTEDFYFAGGKVHIVADGYNDCYGVPDYYTQGIFLSDGFKIFPDNDDEVRLEVLNLPEEWDRCSRQTAKPCPNNPNKNKTGKLFQEDSDIAIDKTKIFKEYENDIYFVPNPFPDHTRFEYSLSAKSNITLTIQNLLGQTVASPINNETKEQGKHYLNFDASSLPAGIYFCTFTATNEKGEVFKETKKLVKLK